MKTSTGESKQPRYAAAYGGKVYVTSYDDTVTRIDTATLAIDGSVKVGRDPDGICINNNKIYVANSGGLDFATEIMTHRLNHWPAELHGRKKD